MNLFDKIPKIINNERKIWHGSALHIYFKYKGKEYVCNDSGGNNPFYASTVRMFAIDGNNKTDVKCKFTNKLLTFGEYNSSCGKREFKNGSITYEYLFEPLGIEMVDNLCYMVDLRKWLENKNIKHYKCLM